MYNSQHSSFVTSILVIDYWTGLYLLPSDLGWVFQKTDNESKTTVLYPETDRK